jgi:hypothetical protein
MGLKTLSSLLLATLLAIAANARADTIEDQAKDAFNEGATLFTQGDFEGSAEAFRRAYALKPSWRLLYNIGQSEAAAKRHGPALEAFEKYLSQGGDDIPEERRTEVIDELERLRPVVGTLEIDAPDGALVIVDGVVRGASPLPGLVRVSAGVDHTVQIRLGKEVLANRTVSVGGRENLVVSVATEGDEPEPVAAPPEPTDQPAPEPTGDAPSATPAALADGPSALATAGWITFGLGAACAITGAIIGGAALSNNKELDQECNDADGCPAADYSDQLDKRDALATASTVLIGVGAAAVAAGVVMLIVDHKRSAEEPAAGVSLAPFAAPGLGGLAVKGRF